MDSDCVWFVLVGPDSPLARPLLARPLGSTATLVTPPGRIAPSALPTHAISRRSTSTGLHRVSTEDRQSLLPEGIHLTEKEKCMFFLYSFFPLFCENDFILSITVLSVAAEKRLASSFGRPGQEIYLFLPTQLLVEESAKPVNKAGDVKDFKLLAEGAEGKGPSAGPPPPASARGPFPHRGGNE